MKFIVLYLVIINLTTLIAFFIDKKKAQRNRFRIPEATLLGLCFIGGALGGLIAMYTFHHKTKKPLFFFFVPLFLIMNVITVIYVIRTFL